MECESSYAEVSRWDASRLAIKCGFTNCEDSICPICDSYCAIDCHCVGDCIGELDEFMLRVNATQHANTQNLFFGQ